MAALEVTEDTLTLRGRVSTRVPVDTPSVPYLLLGLGLDFVPVLLMLHGLLGLADIGVFWLVLGVIAAGLRLVGSDGFRVPVLRPLTRLPDALERAEIESVMVRTELVFRGRQWIRDGEPVRVQITDYGFFADMQQFYWQYPLTEEETALLKRHGQPEIGDREDVPRPLRELTTER